LKTCRETKDDNGATIEKDRDEWGKGISWGFKHLYRCNMDAIVKLPFEDVVWEHRRSYWGPNWAVAQPASGQN
jgi:hypothetical protein